MRTFGLQLAAFSAIGLVALSALAGCGGGGAPAPAGNPNAQDMNLGDLRTRISVVSGPVNATGTACTITGLTGNLSYAAIPLPIGRDIAYSRSDRDNEGVYAINSDGSNPARLVSWGSSPKWSPDGTRIMFSGSSGYDGNTYYYIIRADGPRLTSIYGLEPSWSPDGTRVVYAKQESSNNINTREIYVRELSTGIETRLTNNTVEDISPSWSPDGTRIVFVRNESSSSDRDYWYEIYVMNNDGSNQTRLTNNSVADRSPTWSPDGTQIAFVRTESSGLGDEIYVMNPNGTGQTRLTYNSVSDRSPVWSPDSTRIAFVGGSNWGTYVMNRDGSNQRRVGRSSWSSRPSWSPDGTRLALSDGDSIYIANADGSGERYLTRGRDPDWGPGHSLPLQRVLVGANGLMGASAGGFLYGVTNAGTERPLERAGSFMVFDASSRASLRLSPISPQTPVAVPTFLLTGSNLTLLQWYNFSTQEMTRVIGAQAPLASGSVSAILITYDGSTGLPSSFLPYTRSRAEETPEVVVENGVQTIRGAFNAIIDAHTGKNLAPNGATEVRLDLKTGKVLEWK